MEVSEVCIAFTHRVCMCIILFFEDNHPWLHFYQDMYVPSQEQTISSWLGWLEWSITQEALDWCFYNRVQLSSGGERDIGGGCEQGGEEG